MDMNERKESFWARNWQWFVSIVVFIAFVAFAILLIYCTWPQKQPDLQDLLDSLKKQTTTAKSPHIVKHETTTSRNVPLCDISGRVVTQSVTTTETSSTTKTSNLPESYVVSQEDMDKILTTVALTARKDALDEYKENFSILLAILAVFGIAWPAIVAILQLRFNEGELKKIQEANDAARNMKTQMANIEIRMNDIFNSQLNAQNIIQNFQQEMENTRKIFNEEASLVYGGLGTAFIAFSLQNEKLKVLFIPGILAMRFRQLKYSCKADVSIDDEIESIIDIFNKNTSLFAEQENKELLNEAWKDLDKELLKSKCTAEQYHALEKICSEKNKNDNGDSK